MGKLKKINCEICGESNKKNLHLHHIVERTEVNCDNSDFNLACLCPSCHSKIHTNGIRIIGVFPSTKPGGRLLIYVNELGICNVPGMENAEPYYVPKTLSMKIPEIYIKDKNE